MKIHGYQKLTLLDYPGHVACTVFLGICDFRCPFCHNYELIAPDPRSEMGDEDFFAFLEQRKGQLDAVAVTGGEPCLRPDLPDFLHKIKALGYKVKLDTNGHSPVMLSTVITGGLVDYIAMDIKNGPIKYARTSGVRRLDLRPIYNSISLIMLGKVDYEFRTTVVNELHEESDFDAIGTMIEGARRYFLQPFKDSINVPYGGFHAPDYDTMKRYAHIAAGYVEEARIRGM